MYEEGLDQLIPKRPSSLGPASLLAAPHRRERMGWEVGLRLPPQERQPQPGLQGCRAETSSLTLPLGPSAERLFSHSTPVGN